MKNRGKEKSDRKTRKKT